MTTDPIQEITAISRAVAAGQLVSLPGQVEANVERHVELVRHAVDLPRPYSRPALILFPELSLTGYEIPMARRLAFTAEDPRLEPLRAIAQQEDITLIVGAPRRCEKRFHLSAYVIRKDGSLYTYDKQHLGAFPEDIHPTSPPPAEWTVFEAGKGSSVIEIEGCKHALAICADTGHPEHVERSVSEGATMLLASMFIHPAYETIERQRFEDHALTHGIPILIANHGGVTGNLQSAGKSAFHDPHGTCLASLPSSGTGIVAACRRQDAWTARSFLLKP